MDLTQSLACTDDELKEFIDAYFATALWSENNDEDESLEMDFSAEDFDPESSQRMKSDCLAFLSKHSHTIKEAIDAKAVRFGPDYGPWGRAGHDFWLTRNGHGAGFWDGDWKDPYGDNLTDGAAEFPNVRLYVQDGKVGCEGA